MKDEAEIRAKAKDAMNRYDNETFNPADKEYFENVWGTLLWVLDEGDDPFMDY